MACPPVPCGIGTMFLFVIFTAMSQSLLLPKDIIAPTFLLCVHNQTLFLFLLHPLHIVSAVFFLAPSATTTCSASFLSRSFVRVVLS